MENIGEILKERRLELDKSLDDMSEETKLSNIQLKAIERGDIQFFKDDLSYLTYFVRYYSNALGIDFNEIRDELDDSIMAYTTSIDVSKMEQKEDMSKRVMHTASRGSKAKKKIDYSSIGLFVISLLIIALLGIAFKNVILPAFKNNDPVEPPVVTVPDDPEDNDNNKDDVPSEPEEPEEPEESVLTVNQVENDAYTYEITGWQEDEELIFDFDFNNRSWIRFAEDGVVLDTPNQGIYERDENAKVIIKAKKDKVLNANIGYPKGNTVSLNDEQLEINPEAANSTSGIQLNFKLVEGENE